MPQRKILALLISLFVLPGMGHVYLGEKKKGYLLAILICLFLLFLILFFEINLVQEAQKAANPFQILSSIFDYAAMAWMKDRLVYNTGLGLITLLWAYAAVDLLRKKP